MGVSSTFPGKTGTPGVPESTRCIACQTVVRLYNAPMSQKSLVGVVMGSKSDWDVMKSCDEMLSKLGVNHECRILSAHRTPDALVQWVRQCEAQGVEVFIAAAGGAAHLAGVVAAYTVLPVLGVPMESASLKGMDSLLSMVQMPGGIPVGTLAIGKPGATNAALLAVAILATSRPELRVKLKDLRDQQAKKILGETVG